MNPAGVGRKIVAALALLCIIRFVWILLRPLWWRLLLLWAVIEALYYVAVFLPRHRHLNRQPEPHEPANHEAMKHWRRFIRYSREVPGGMDYQAYLSTWFKGTDFQQIKRGMHAARRDSRACHRVTGMLCVVNGLAPLAPVASANANALHSPAALH